MIGKIVTCVLALVVLLSPQVGRADDAVKLKFVTAIYADGQSKPLKYPEGIACTGDSMVIADTANHRLVRYGFQNKQLTSEATYDLEKIYPLVVQVASTGELFVLDGRARRIVRLSAQGAVLGPLEMKGVPGSKPINPRKFVIDKSDSMYVLDLSGERVIVLNAKGAFQRQVPFPKEYGFFSGLNVDQRGNLYLVDSVRGVVLKSDGGSSPFVPFSSGLKEYLNFATSITFDNQGRMFLVDQNGSGIVVLAVDGSFLKRQLTMGWNEGNLLFPTQACVNESGDFFIADRNNNRVQMFSIMEK